MRSGFAEAFENVERNLAADMLGLGRIVVGSFSEVSFRVRIKAAFVMNVL